MKLELKHLALYLPYGLNLLIQEVICELEGFDLHKKETLIAERVNYKLTECKPILRPLSELTKEIEVNGEKFVPWNLLEIDSSIVDFLSVNNQPIIRLIDCEFIYAIDVYNNIIQKLIEWHFDVFGLIEKGLAIDINSLPQSSE